ncbi:hypothetical protein LPJ78_005268 [Coemansia sp. RSA 989]|nr:hypothetical protein BX667DRAFT_146882 [Coemansia mojavensis]KAJ1739170.1 hypothetical protein LPJ68_004923 [Coemansia sp. RSA 1086]KAJ1747529.1 hypothetical protein LPJ79_005181 [Coemansia sp. RSA 1821]KAJ1861547.1 hypothetical protein LPJ78_005268 [Coemansia sp. RSA 989]KAJ1869329.1 hypothetical protein LPJ55_005434 [Coemansia sp. RSA 990]KAJ2629325.1 hypothetical protein H4R22_003385 [Coemansia sp. RSA 1290]KAJ2646104.1 hypothetical protein IWW40_005659 [Coemansia sp. RSA 1250]KAJ26678
MNSSNANRLGSEALSVVREFEPTTQRRERPELPAYEARVPEPVNNYNLPADRKLIDEKVALLKEQFPTFANKSADDLEDLLRFEDLFQAHIDGLEQVQLMRTLEYELREENERLAEVNLSAEEELRKMRDNVAELQMFASSLTSRFYELVQEHLDLQKPYSPTVLLAKLREECAELDTQSEDLATALMSKDGTIEAAECEDFVRQYKDLRAKYHSSDMRSTLAEAAYKNGTLAGVPMTMDR